MQLLDPFSMAEVRFYRVVDKLRQCKHLQLNSQTELYQPETHTTNHLCCVFKHEILHHKEAVDSLCFNHCPITLLQVLL